jgi:hypothetical protein
MNLGIKSKKRLEELKISFGEKGKILGTMHLSPSRAKKLAGLNPFMVEDTIVVKGEHSLQLKVMTKPTVGMT